MLCPVCFKTIDLNWEKCFYCGELIDKRWYLSPCPPSPTLEKVKLFSKPKLCYHGILGGRTNGKCPECNRGLVQKMENWKELGQERAKQKAIFSGIYYKLCSDAIKLKKDEIKEIRKALCKDLDFLLNLSPYGFETCIANLFKDMGYMVKQTPRTNDGGFDCIAYKNNQSFYIECKRYNSENLVGRPALQKFFAAISVDSVNTGFFVTTSDYTLAAQLFAEKARIESNIDIKLINGNELISMMKDTYSQFKEKKQIKVMCCICGDVVIFELNNIDYESQLCCNGHIVKKNIFIHKGNVRDLEEFIDYTKMYKSALRNKK